MPHYLYQTKYSSAAIKAMTMHPHDREAAARGMVERFGGKLHQVFFSFGPYDAMGIVEAPDDKAAAAISLVLGASGAFSGVETTKLLTPAEAHEAMIAAGAGAATYQPPTR